MSKAPRRVARAILTLVVPALSSIGPHAAADEPDYRFLSVQTIQGPCCSDWGADLDIDVNGNVLVAGRRGGLDLDRDGSVDIQSHGTPDPMVLRALADNGELEWVRGPGGPGDDWADGVASDGWGGAYAVGLFSDKMRLGPGIISSSGGKDGFLVRYDDNGEVLWAKAVGGAGDDRLFDVARDETGNAYVIGTIVGEVDVDGDGDIDVATAGRSAFLLASFDPEGVMRWTHASAGTAAVMGWAVATGPSGEVYVGGHYMAGTLDIDGDGTADAPASASEPAGTPPLPDMNGFFARFDASGSMVWSRSVSGPRLQTVGSMAVAGNGDLLVLGGYTDPADLDGDGAPDMAFRSIAGRVWAHHLDANVFLLRLSPEGERRWARRYAATARHVSADATRIVVTGSYNGALDFDDDGVHEREADPDEWVEGFVAILDGDGRLRHTFTISGGDADEAKAAAFTRDGKRLYVTGYTRLGADFSGDGMIESESACHRLGDVFLAVYDVED